MFYASKQLLELLEGWFFSVRLVQTYARGKEDLK